MKKKTWSFSTLTLTLSFQTDPGRSESGRSYFVHAQVTWVIVYGYIFGLACLSRQKRGTESWVTNCQSFHKLTCKPVAFAFPRPCYVLMFTPWPQSWSHCASCCSHQSPHTRHELPVHLSWQSIRARDASDIWMFALDWTIQFDTAPPFKHCRFSNA